VIWLAARWADKLAALAERRTKIWRRLLRLCAVRSPSQRAPMRVRYPGSRMTSSGTYVGWWDLSLIDKRNERPLHVALVAVIAIWATAFLFALV
jgi:hypothetical protein